MGITQNSLNRFDRYIATTDTMLILGCQNIYSDGNYGELAHDFFKAKGFKPYTIDITGCQESVVADLRDDLHFSAGFGVVMQHGTLEHIHGKLYQPFKNIHEACADGGFMIHENPMTGNWPEHGYHYFTQKFFIELAKSCHYDLLEICSEAAMGNTVDGWNICAVLRKTDTMEFISEKAFNKIYAKHIRSK